MQQKSAGGHSFLGCSSRGGNVLFADFTEDLVGVLRLLLEQLHPARQGLVLRAVLRALVGNLLELGGGLLQALQLRLQHTVLVLHRRELLVLGQVLGLELLDLVLKILHLGGQLVRLQTELVHLLLKGEAQVVVSII